MQLDQPLSDKEFDELDQFLLSERCPEDAMTMDTLHGFLTAIAIGPEDIMLAEWLPHVWGNAVDNPAGKETATGPTFKNAKESERIIGLISRFMNEIMVTLEVAPKEFEPLFCEHEHEGKTLIDAEAWCWGFWEGLEMRNEAWDPIFQSNFAPLMRPIYLLGADDVEEDELELMDNPVKAHKLAIEIESNLPDIHRFFMPLRKSAVATVKRDTPKIGRNDDCSCGSGKKYKKCCGADPVAQ